TITGDTVFSGLIQVRPKINMSNSNPVILTGTRGSATNVWVNQTKLVPLGSDDWAVSYYIAEGDNILEIWLQDEASNKSTSLFVDIFADTIAPVFNSITPDHNSFLNYVPETVTISYDEMGGTGLDLDNTIHSTKDSSQNEVSGTWEIKDDNSLIFTPANSFKESEYTIVIGLTDKIDNKADTRIFNFTFDVTPPDAPQIDSFDTPVHNALKIFTGTKEAFASILVNNVNKIGNTEQTTWEYPAALALGTNTFVFNAVDRVGNKSEPATAEIVYINIDTLMNGYDLYNERKTELIKEQKKLETNLNSKSKSLERKAMEFQQKVEKRLVTNDQAQSMQQ
ncbi:MAG: hypothetical protein KAR45_07290, partial [Desulfobacteraceae bacterium]|nr:hypothetical protein [Desulfobacteraceae bacterium]